MSSDTHGTKSKLVQVVDDDLLMRTLARDALEMAGFSVIESPDGEQGLVDFERHRPDLVLLDVMMPGMDGFTVCRALRWSPLGEDTPILMMTGLDDLDSIRKAYEAGATDFITKPINWVILVYRVRYMLRASQAIMDLRTSEERLSHAQQLARMGSWEWDVIQDKLYWSREVYQIFDIDPLGFDATYQAFLNSVHPLDKELVNKSLEDAISGRSPFSIDHLIVLPDGAERFVHTEAEVSFDEQGRAVWVAGTVQDITERKQAEEQIRYLAYYDSLTGLPNRVLFKEHLEHALIFAERHRKKVAALFLDLDRFKWINDTLGHAVGDTLLQGIAERLKQCVRRHDLVSRSNDDDDECGTIARIGGDEFTVLLEDIEQAQDVVKVARRLLEVAAETFILEGHEVFVTASIGISIFPDDGRDAATLIKNADTAMYHAKELGRNNFQFYTQAMNATAFERLVLENQLRKALEREELLVHYQPQVDVRQQRIIGLEALVRWHSPELGMVSPGTFIPFAEETGQVTSIDEWVLTTACLQLREWQVAGLPPVRMAVNLSGHHFFKNNLLETVNRIIRETGMDPRLLELELTEGVLMHNVAETITTLNKLKELGISLSVDDFGTGYSSLSYLKRFPLDVLKIDQSFVREVAEGSDNSAIIQAIIAMAKSLRLRVIAEGVETEEQLEFLHLSGCNEMQGYLFGRPVPAAEAKSLLNHFIWSTGSLFSRSGWRR
jgi:diguanylate cyclase (GGDEF)-like protein/PAS domain S-box-containing protein